MTELENWGEISPMFHMKLPIMLQSPTALGPTESWVDAQRIFPVTGTIRAVSSC